MVEISDQELEETDPTPLVLLKRLVNDFDLLEVSDPVAWAVAVDAITTEEYQRMFTGSNFDRERYRYLVYGYEDSRLSAAFDELDAAFP